VILNNKKVFEFFDFKYINGIICKKLTVIYLNNFLNLKKFIKRVSGGKMKKIIYGILLFMLAITYVGCKKDEVYIKTIEDYYKKLCEYQQKLDVLSVGASVGEGEGEFTEESIGELTPLSTSQDDNKKYTREYFLDVYNNQVDNTNDVKMCNELYPYKALLDEVISMFDEDDDIELDQVIELNADKNYSFSISDFEYIIIAIEVSYYEVVEKITVKMGYDNDGNFILKEYKTYSDSNDIFYYQEFIENNHRIAINFQGFGNYNYHYISAIDNESFLLYYGDIESDIGPLTGYNITWFNNDTKVRSLLSFSDGNLAAEHYEVFNDKGITFTYSDFNQEDTKAKLAWNMLEVTGWDYVYIENIEGSNNQPQDGIYKNGSELFENANFSAYKSIYYAHIGITEEYEISEINDSLINLSTYGLEFLQTDINYSYLEDMRASSLTESHSLCVYDGIDLLGDNVKAELHQKIDQDILNFRISEHLTQT